MELEEKQSGELIPSPGREDDAGSSPSRNSHGIMVWLMTVLERFANRGIDEDELLAAVRGVGSYAAESRILPEKLIIAPKTAWGEVAPRSASAANWMDDRLLPRLVTACLDGYYGS